LKRTKMATSTVLSTVILASVLIVIVGAAYVAADNAIDLQIENAQFDQAKNVMLSLTNVIKSVLLNPHSSGYVRSSFWNTVPQFERTNGNLTLTIVDSINNETLDAYVTKNVVKIKGGQLVGVLTPTDLLGNSTDRLINASDSLGTVRVFQSDGAWVSLDYLRVRCVYIGSSNYYTGTGYESFNLFEITLVNVTFGVFEPGTQAFITVQNLGITPVPMPPDGWSNSTTVQVSLDGGESEGPYVLGDMVEEKGGDPAKPILINLAIVNIEVSMFRGG